MRSALGRRFSAIGSGESSGFKDKGRRGPLATKTDANRGRRVSGPGRSHAYFGGHHELTGMLGGQYYFASVPGGRRERPPVWSPSSPITFHIMKRLAGDHLSFLPSTTERNLMPLFEQGAQGR